MIKAAKGWYDELGVLESWGGYAGPPPTRWRAGTVCRPVPQCYTIHSCSTLRRDERSSGALGTTPLYGGDELTLDGAVPLLLEEERPPLLGSRRVRLI